MNIAIIEDDKMIREELAILLKNNEYEVVLITDFDNILNELKKHNINLILLDINLPNTNGFEICKNIKKELNTPIIFVTSRNTLEDELLSIRIGGIDFITKPYNKNILLAKIKRAINNNNPINYKEITVKNYTLDLHLSLLKSNDKEIELTRNEFLILYYFFTNPNRIITKEELLEYLWNDKYYLDENILTVNLNRLRKKVSEIGIKGIIKTIRGKGYKI